MSLKAQLLVALVAGVFIPELFAKTHASGSGFAGTWVRSGTSSTVSIQLRGQDADLTYSEGSPDSGSVDGNVLTYHGRINGSAVKTSGTFRLSSDGNTLSQTEQAFYPEGTKTTNVTWKRASSGSATAETTVSKHDREPATQQQSTPDDQIVGRWTFPMGQTYTFKADGTFSGDPGVSGRWKFVRMNQGNDASAEYHLDYKSGGHSEVLTLIRGDREGHEYETGHTLRLGQQMRVRKQEDGAAQPF